ncbi:hypothetical protein P8452_28667 [Trifolium repens]|nr:hypothetical protein P8452_28667 [Trifolium repens]
MKFFHESSTNQTNVSITMAEHLFSKYSNNNKNTVFSPLSLQVILSIIAAGSEGPTQRQLLNFLCFKSIHDLTSFFSKLVPFMLKDAAPFGGPRLSFANGVWVEKTLPLRPSFKRIVSSDYKATLASVDFLTKALEVRKEVNLWADKETNGFIKEILPQESVDNLTKLIFANALYFKGVWNESFPRRMTYDYDFHLLNGNSVKVPFMTNRNKQFIRAFDGYKVLRLLYKKGEDKRQFYMDIFLPNQKNGLPALIKKVASKPELLYQKLPLEKVAVDRFRIPKFKFTFGLETSHALKELGVILPFYEGGLTNMVDSPEGKDLFVSEIFHKSFIEVNEEGTEAAAVTAAIIKTRGMCMSTELDFIADHPFLFLIGEVSTSTILFMGHMLNPLVGGS